MPSELYTSLEQMIEWGEGYLTALSASHEQLNKDMAEIESKVPEHKREGYEAELAANKVKSYSDITSSMYSVLEEIVENRKSLLDILNMETIDGTHIDMLMEQMESINDEASFLSGQFDKLQEALEGLDGDEQA